MSCSSVFVDYTLKDTDKEFEPYIQEFSNIIKDSKNHYKIKKTKIVFHKFKVKEGSNYMVLGKCYGMFSNTYLIRISEDYWKEASFISKQFTIYHELGHCVCNLFHTDTSHGSSGTFENILYKLKNESQTLNLVKSIRFLGFIYTLFTS